MGQQNAKDLVAAYVPCCNIHKEEENKDNSNTIKFGRARPEKKRKSRLSITSIVDEVGDMSMDKLQSHISSAASEVTEGARRMSHRASLARASITGDSADIARLQGEMEKSGGNKESRRGSITGTGLNVRRVSEVVPASTLEQTGADQLQEAITQGRRRSSLLVGMDGLANDPEAQAALAKRRLQDDLVTASMRGDLSKIQAAVEQGANLGHKNARGVAPMMLVASSNNKTAIDALKWILEQKVEVDEQDGNGWTSLLHAARNGRSEMCQALIEFQSDPNMKANDGTTAVHMAAMEGKKDLLRQLIEGTNTKLYSEPDQKGWTPLFYAAREGHGEAVEWLISVNAKYNEKAEKDENRRPLMVACEAGHWKVCQILINKKSNVEDTDSEHRTALFYAVMNGHETVACNLVKPPGKDSAAEGANPFAKSKGGESLAQIALEQGMNHFRSLLRGREEGFA